MKSDIKYDKGRPLMRLEKGYKAIISVGIYDLDEELKHWEIEEL